jgi:4-hydroxybenzoate polyprenyltransferase
LGSALWRDRGGSGPLLVYEHSLVKPDDLSRVNAAFFTMNGYVSVLFFVFWAADILLLKPGA